MRFIPPLRLRTAPLAALAVLLALRPAARAEDTLREELSELARSVQKQLAGDNETSLALGAFTGPADHFPSNAGPGIVLALRDELTQLGVKIDPEAHLTMKGTYEDVLDPKLNRVFIELAARLEDRAGKTVVVMEKRGAFGEAALASVAGVTAVLPLDETGSKGREDAVVKSIDQPKTTIIGKQVRAAPDSPYGVEVLVKQGDGLKSREPRDEKGYAYVPIKRDEVYALRLTNDSSSTAAVTLKIDGVDAFSFCDFRDPKTNQPAFTVFIIAPHTSEVVVGWPINAKRSDEFLVTDYAHSAAAELKASGADVGVVTASFAAAWPFDGKPPADEPGGKGVDATGRGTSISHPDKAVPPHKVGVVRAVVSVRYTK